MYKKEEGTPFLPHPTLSPKTPHVYGGKVVV